MAIKKRAVKSDGATRPHSYGHVMRVSDQAFEAIQRRRKLDGGSVSDAILAMNVKEKSARKK